MALLLAMLVAEDDDDDDDDDDGDGVSLTRLYATLKNVAIFLSRYIY